MNEFLNIGTKPEEDQTYNTFLETYFSEFRKGVIGIDHCFESLYGKKKMLYADWIASGRLYRPIEELIVNKAGPTMANTHSFSSQSGKLTTYAYRHARKLIRAHVGAGEEDVLVTTGTGMTAALSKLIRVMGLEQQEERPVVFITHMEHHSNQVPWYALGAEVIILPPGKDLKVSPELLEKELQKYQGRRLKIGSFTACSNVTGEITPYHKLAAVMHRAGGLCFVDFAASAPYVEINMHPAGEEQALDAIFFSPHKFLGGPGSCGILVFNKKLYNRSCPDTPGGGNVKWTTPWGDYGYFDDIEIREDPGTPGILQVIRAALAISLKEKMGADKIEARERELLDLFHERMSVLPQVSILGDPRARRIGCVSFNISGLHYNLVVRLLNDRFGIQVRGGWSCASTFSHYLFDLQNSSSEEVVQGIRSRDLTAKPGWVRLSLHPVLRDEELEFICKTIEEIVANAEKWRQDYRYNCQTNEFDPLLAEEDLEAVVSEYFVL